MENKGRLTKYLAIAGTVLAWIPLLTPLLLSALYFAAERVFLVDYLMPAELFPLALAGGILLLWASFRAHARRCLIGWSLGLAIVLLAGGQALAAITGLASGEIAPTGWPWALVLTSFGLFVLSLLTMDIGGALLIRDLYKPAGKTSPT